MTKLPAISRYFKTHPVRAGLAILPIAILGAWVFMPNIVHASVLQDALSSVIGFIFSIFVYIFGNLLVKFIDILIWVASYNDFINTEAVKVGWTVVRDLANMFFIVALLLIAFGTIFGFSEYRYSRMLQKVIFMAILINFSKLICGLLIDFSQVIMLTFVNAFRDLAAGTITSGFGVDKIVAFSKTASAQAGDINTLSIVGAMFAAIVMLFIATTIVAIFTVYLIQRIIMLWIYIILSPMAFLTFAFPSPLGGFWNSWWGTFTKYLIRGPVIAFYLWLSLTVIQYSNNILGGAPQDNAGTIGETSQLSTIPAYASEATTSANIMNYLVVAGLLIAGLSQTAAAGGIAGGMAGKAMGKFQQWGGSMAKSPFRLAGALTKKPAYDIAGKTLGKAADIGNSRFLGWTGLGTSMGKLNSRLTRQRQKSEDKDTDWINYADEKTVARLGTAQMSLTEGGRKNQKAARERMFKNNELKNLSEGDRAKVLKGYHNDIGRKFIPRDGAIPARETFTDAAGARLLNDALEKDPTILTADWGNLSNSEKNYRKGQMRKNMSKMSAAEIAKMNEKAWKDKNFADAILNDPNDAFGKRFDKSTFIENVSRNVGTNVKDPMRAAMIAAGHATKGPAGIDRTSFQQDINRERQERTADRIAKYRDQGLNFHESDEYKNNAIDFYDLESFNANEAQQQRKKEREDQLASGVNLPITGISGFSGGKSNNLAVGKEIFEEAGVEVAAGATITDPEEKRKVAGVVVNKIVKDIQDIENTLNTTPVEQLDTIPEGATTSMRKKLEMRKAKLEQSWERLEKPDELGGIGFINQDREGGAARNLNAEETYHQKLKAMDADGSFREQLRQSMSPKELQKITADMRAISGQENYDDKQAFEEYLAKGLTNLSRGTWADTSPNAVKMDQKLALPLLAQAEKAGVSMKLDDLQEVANVQIPGRFDTLGAGTRAVARGAKQKAGSIASTVVGGVSSAVTGVAAATAGAAAAVGRKVGQGATAPIRAAQRFSGRRAAEESEKKRAEIPGEQLGVRFTQAGLQSKRQELSAYERQVQQETDEMNRQYQEQEQTMNTTTDSLVARRSAEKMKELRTNIKDKAKELKTKRDGVKDYEVMLANSQQSLGENVGGAFRASEKANQRMAAGQGVKQQVASAKTPASPTQSTSPVGQAQPQSGSRAGAFRSASGQTTVTTNTGAGVQPGASEAAGSAEGNTTVINNVRNEITQVIKSAPQDFRDTLKLSPDSLNMVLRNLPVMRSLMGNLRNGFEGMLKAEKNLSADSQNFMKKSLGNLQKHVDNNDVEGFREEFQDLQNIFRDIG